MKLCKIIDRILSRLPVPVILLYLRVFKPRLYQALCCSSAMLCGDVLKVGYDGAIIDVKAGKGNVVMEGAEDE